MLGACGARRPFGARRSSRTVAAGKGDVFKLCVRLEVALADSAEWAEKLTGRLRQLAEAESQGWPAMADEVDGGGAGQGQAWPH